MSNPPLEILRTAEQGEQDDRMSYPKCARILMELARKRTMTVEQVDALQMGARKVMVRHFQRQRNWAKRRAAKEGGGHV